MLKLFVLVLIIGINLHNICGKFLPRTTNELDNSMSEGHKGHKVEKRDAYGEDLDPSSGETGTASQTQLSTGTATQSSKIISMADIKLMTRLIFTKLKENFKKARAETRTWSEFIMALVSAGKNAIVDSITEFIMMKTRQKIQETVQSYTGGTFGMIGGLTKLIGV